MLKLFKKLTGDPTTRVLEKVQPLLEQINALEPQVQALSEAQMRARTAEFRRRIADETAAARQALAEKRAELDAETDPDRRLALREEWKERRRALFEAEQQILDEILPEAFALVREAAVRTIGQRHYDVQLIGGIVLHRGMIAEMKTGEGKTLAATLPLYLNALVGRGAHLVTVNDYLARRDCGWMGQIFYRLGLSTAVIIPDFSGLYDPAYTDESVPGRDERLMHLRPCTRQEAYRADITYGTNNEFGFDYLRDHMAYNLHDVVQQELYYAIIDEVDNILIDEARTPLIISAPDTESYQHYLRFARLVHNLSPGDYEIDEKERVVTLTESGVDRVERQLGIDHSRGESLYDEQHAELTFFLEAALKARLLFEKNVDYIIQDGQVVIVDEFTGRLMPGRRWSDGIHEAVEAKEKVIYGEPVEVQRESKTYATITFQNLFRLYQKLAGMTGTAATEQEEFFKIYGLEVAVIPTNRPVIREDYPDQIYAREKAKYDAVVREIAERHQQGQPVLVGTTSVEKSEYLSRLLKKARIPHQVLNAKRHAEEAVVVARAGEEGAVTIATNMAGRGVDIILGGDPAHRSDRQLRPFVLTPAFFQTVIQIPPVAYRRGEAVAQMRKDLPQALLERLGKRGEAEEYLNGLAAWVGQAVEAYHQARSRLGQLNNRLRPLLQERLLARLEEEPDGAGLEGIVRELAGHIVAGRVGPEILLAWARAGGLAHQFVEEAQVDYQYLLEVQKGRLQAVAERLLTDYQSDITLLIRLVLGGQRERAEALVAGRPALPAFFIEELEAAYRDWERENERIKQLGGLHVIGTERHEARRIDNQLRGRSGRQGDSGSSRFYVSTEDDLIRRFGPGADRMRALLERFNPDDETPIEARVITRMIDQAQTSIEGHHFDIRKHLVEYDDVLNRQREVIYAERWRILSTENVQGLVLSRLYEEIADRVEEAFASLESLKPYERDEEAVAEVLGTLLEGIQRGRQSREGSRRPLFPILGQILVEQFRQDPLLWAYEQLQAIQQQRLAVSGDGGRPAEAVVAEEDAAGVAETPVGAIAEPLPAQAGEGDESGGDGTAAALQERLKEAAAAFRELGRPEEAATLDQLATAVETLPKTLTAPDDPIARFLAPLERPAGQALQQRLEEVIDQALSRRRERSEEAVAQTVDEHLYGEETDERGAHLMRLYRTLTRDLRIPLPATSTTARWVQQEPEEIRAEVLKAAAEMVEEDLHRARQQILEQVPVAVRRWQESRAAWWHIVDFLNEVDRFYRLPADLVLEPLLDLSPEGVTEQLYGLARGFLEGRERRLGAGLLRQIERGYLLRAIDQEWVDYLTAMQDLRQGIGLQAYGQRDPLVEYRRQSYHLFQRLLQRVREQALFYIFQASQTPVRRQAQRPAREREPGKKKQRRRAQDRGRPSRPKAKKPRRKKRG